MGRKNNVYCLKCLGSLTAHPTDHGFCHCGGNKPVMPTVLTKKNLKKALNMIADMESTDETHGDTFPEWFKKGMSAMKDFNGAIKPCAAPIVSPKMNETLKLVCNLKGEKTVEPEETIDSLTKKLAESKESLRAVRYERNMLRQHRDNLDEQLTEARKERDELAIKLNNNPLLNILHTRAITTAEEVAEIMFFYDKNRGKKLMDVEPVHLKDLAGIVNAHVVFDSEKTTAQNILEGVAHMGKMIVRLTESENRLTTALYDLNDKCSAYGREKLAYQKLSEHLEQRIEDIKKIHALDLRLSPPNPCAHESCATACLAEEISLIDNMEQD